MVNYLKVNEKEMKISIKKKDTLLCVYIYNFTIRKIQED